MTLTEALRRLHEQGRIRVVWPPGVQVVEDGIWWRATNYGWTGGYNDGRWAHSVGTTAAPVLDDPATVGCLLALLREASGRPRLHPTPYLVGSGWGIASGGLDIEPNEAPTEGEAIAAALIALAGP